ncbi:MAG: methyltransferase domain-containing protein [Deltaproteobacteria bacterium]|nr:methyltransferase domain-containing protein [Deltaproteobacteria bacterium]
MPKTEPFEKYSDAYDEWFERNSDLYAMEMEAIRRLIPPDGEEGMEVGVGSGKFAAPFGIRIGVEPSERMAVRARAQGIDVHQGIAEELPFPGDRFDFVLMVTTICFVDDIDMSFREVFRVLKPGGCIIVGFVDRESERGRQYTGRKEESRFYKEATFFSAQEVLTHLETAGFEITETKQTLIPGEVPETIADGFGKGAFVAVKGVKKVPGR